VWAYLPEVGVTTFDEHAEVIDSGSHLCAVGTVAYFQSAPRSTGGVSPADSPADSRR
jgi:hypothetical protein